ncbi:MAG: HmuY family protein [Muribaculaceae bacterium]
MKSYLKKICLPALATLCTACNGIFGGVYDEPQLQPDTTVSGELYIDASDWQQWHYIDLRAVAAASAANPGYNPSSAWVTMPVPTEELSGSQTGDCGIYTYWYDVLGQGISVREFRSKYPTLCQNEPDVWTIAVHRNNVRTNGASVAETDFKNIEDVPEDTDFLASLNFVSDTWSESEVWVIPDKMLLGLIGNQGIDINPVLSRWLTINIPPLPPSFTLNDNVFVIKCDDGTYGALQLVNYQSPTGLKCCLTIKYKYPINV